MNKIVCVGSSSKDIFFPTGAGLIMETPEDLTSKRKIAFELGAKFQVDRVVEAPGGCAANVSQGMARLGVEAGCYTKIGNDDLGDWIKKELESEGVDIELMQVDRECVSDLSAIIVDEESKDHIIFFNRDANTKLEIHKDKLTETEWLFVSALNGNWQLHFDKILEVVEERNIKLAFTPGQRNIRDDVDKIVEFSGKCDVLIFNKDEAIEIGTHVFDGEGDKLDDEIFLLDGLQKINSGIVVITDGERGAWSFDGEKIIHASAIKKDAVDTLGAGDAFASGFLSGYVEGVDIEECLKWGIVNGGNVVMYFGAKKGLLNREEIVENAKEVKTEFLR